MFSEFQYGVSVLLGGVIGTKYFNSHNSKAKHFHTSVYDLFLALKSFKMVFAWWNPLYIVNNAKMISFM